MTAEIATSMEPKIFVSKATLQLKLGSDGGKYKFQTVVKTPTPTTETKIEPEEKVKVMTSNTSNLQTNKKTNMGDLLTSFMAMERKHSEMNLLSTKFETSAL